MIWRITCWQSTSKEGSACHLISGTSFVYGRARPQPGSWRGGGGLPAHSSTRQTIQCTPYCSHAMHSLLQPCNTLLVAAIQYTLYCGHTMHSLLQPYNTLFIAAIQIIPYCSHTTHSFFFAIQCTPYCRTGPTRRSGSRRASRCRSAAAGRVQSLYILYNFTCCI
jgi:hypothetical protein